MRRVALGPLAAAFLGALGGSGTADPPSAEGRLGGPATVDADGPQAFSFPAPGLSREERRAFSVGNSFFRDNWVIAPASAAGRDGLGPLFNALSCSACHAEDGRGRPPLDREERSSGLVARLSAPDADGAPHPIYGSQLQDRAIPGVAPEAALRIEAVPVRGRFADGTAYELERLVASLDAPAYGDPGPLRISLRVGPQLIGMGLLEAIDDATLRALADPDDRDGDGISGRAHLVPAPDGSIRVGRFGWKASHATLEAQVAAALREDIGITSPTHPLDNLTATQRTRIPAPSGGDPEIDDFKVGRIAHYCRVLAVPRQRDTLDARVRHGRELFASLGCADCHRPTLVTGHDSPIAAFRGVTIHPYTDLLLHDLGDELADDRRDGDATGREWRTPPLWGIGLVETVNGHTRFLHDGRARSLEEAILWHGGEAERARDGYRSLPAADRAALLAFLRSL